MSPTPVDDGPVVLGETNVTNPATFTKAFAAGQRARGFERHLRNGRPTLEGSDQPKLEAIQRRSAARSLYQ